MILTWPVHSAEFVVISVLTWCGTVCGYQYLENTTFWVHCWPCLSRLHKHEDHSLNIHVNISGFLAGGSALSFIHDFWHIILLQNFCLYKVLHHINDYEKTVFREMEYFLILFSENLEELVQQFCLYHVCYCYYQNVTHLLTIMCMKKLHWKVVNSVVCAI